MPRLVVLNGPPGIGKSTLARRFVADHPGWRVAEQDHLPGSPEQAREQCVALIRSHLRAGHDVLVPQFVARPSYLDRLSALAAECGASYVELVLLTDLDVAERRFRARLDGPVIEDYTAEYARLVVGLEGRPVQRIDSTDLDVDYRQLVALLNPF